MAGKNPKKECK